MQKAAVVARRSSLHVAFALVGAGALVTALAACAAAPVDDDLGGTVSETNKAETEGNSTTLPPSNPPAPKPDAGSGSTKDSGTTQQKDSSAPPPQDSGSGTGTSTSCDPGDPLNLVKALDELNKATPRTCGIMGGSCQPSECCFDVYGVCID